MNTEWAIQELDQFIDLTVLVKPPPTPGVTRMYDDRHARGSKSDIASVAQVTDQILDQVLPGWRTAIPESERHIWEQRREACVRAKAQLERQAEIDENLGDTSPALKASGFHPWAWEAARSLWQSGHYREAVRAAATKINAETQNKVGNRNLADTELFQLYLGEEPATTQKPRLRLPLDDGGKTARSVRRGLVRFAEGCFAAIRNPHSHETDTELSEQEALEQLASLSVLARWIDAAELRSSDPEPGH